MSSAQLHRDPQANTGDLPQADPSQVYPQADPSQQQPPNPQNRLDPTSQPTSAAGGTDVVGEPVNPAHSPASHGTHSTADPPSSTDSVNPPPSQSRASPYTLGPNDGNFPTAQPPGSFSTAERQQEAPTTPGGGQAQSASPYVQTSPATESTSGNKSSPMDSIMQVFNRWGKKAEDMTGNVWTHLKTGPNMADTAMGRLSLGARAFSEGGLEKVYRQTFDVAPDEHLLKTYACYLSTSTGPVAGTLYISTLKLAFCSDRPLSMPGSSPQADPDNSSTNQPESTAASAKSPTSKNSPGSQQVYYKVVVPISQVEAVNPSENSEKPTEKFVEVRTNDGHEFWFMGFVNYDKGVKNLQETLRNKDTPAGTINADQLNRDTTPTTDNNQLDRGNDPAAYDGNQRDRGMDPAAYNGNQMDRGANPATYDDGNQLDRGVNPTYDGNELDKGSIPATYDGNQLDRGANPANYGENQIDRGANPANYGENQIDRGANPATYDEKQLDGGANPATYDENQLNRGANPATYDENQLDRGANPATYDGNQVDRGANASIDGNQLNRDNIPAATDGVQPNNGTSNTGGSHVAA